MTLARSAVEIVAHSLRFRLAFLIETDRVSNNVPDPFPCPNLPSELYFGSLAISTSLTFHNYI